MRIGELRKQITIQTENADTGWCGRLRAGLDRAGDPVGRNCAAERQRDFYRRNIWKDHVTHRITLRYRSDVTITPDMRAVYNNRIFNIRSRSQQRRAQPLAGIAGRGRRTRMSDALFAVQQAVYNALAASTEVQALLGNPPRIYDHVPPNAVFPYIAFGAIAWQNRSGRYARPSTGLSSKM